MMTLRIRAIVRVRIVNDDADVGTAFGRGTAELLRGIERTGSLNAAAKDMGMAYSKAWKSLNATEAQLGVKLIERNVPKGSKLTTEGRSFLDMYGRAEAASEAAAEAVIEQYLSEFDETDS